MLFSKGRRLLVQSTAGLPCAPMLKLSRVMLQKELFILQPMHCKRQVSDVSKQSSKIVLSTSTTNAKTDEHEAEGSLSCNGSFESAVSMVTIIPGKGLPPEPPMTCCMSGCSNCVWIKYLEELSDYYRDGGEMAKCAIDQIPDETIKAFLRMSL